MEKLHSCILCGASDSVTLDNIKGEELSCLYNKMGVKYLKLPEYLTLLECTNCNLKWFSPALMGDGKFYEELQKYEWYYQKNKVEFEFSAQAIVDRKFVVEVGCGSGHFAHLLSTSTRYIGLEFNDSAINKAKCAGLDVRKQMIEDFVSESPGNADAVVAFQVLEHVSNPKGFLKACSGALASDGLLVISVPNEDSFLGDAINNCLNLPPHHVTRWTKTTFEIWARQNGYTIQDVFEDPIAPYHLVWWRATKLRSKLRELIGMHRCQIDLSLRWRLISLLCAVLARVLPIKSEGKLGHSITVVMKKTY